MGFTNLVHEVFNVIKNQSINGTGIYHLNYGGFGPRGGGGGPVSVIHVVDLEPPHGVLGTLDQAGCHGSLLSGEEGLGDVLLPLLLGGSPFFDDGVDLLDDGLGGGLLEERDREDGVTRIFNQVGYGGLVNLLRDGVLGGADAFVRHDAKRDVKFSPLHVLDVNPLPVIVDAGDGVIIDDGALLPLSELLCYECHVSSFHGWDVYL